MAEQDTIADKTYPPPAELMRTAHVAGPAAYRALVAEAAQHHEAYWARLARELIDWKTPFETVLDRSEAPHFKWFADGTLNVSYNCLDRHVMAGLGDKPAIVFEADDGRVTRTTYAELLERTCRTANALRALGVAKGDRVVITCRCRSTASSRCRRAHASVRSTPSSSVASPRNRCATASRTPVRCW